MSARRNTDDTTDPRVTAKAVKEAQEKMVAPEGGKYKTPDGRTVDAWGEEVNEASRAKAADADKKPTDA